MKTWALTKFTFKETLRTKTMIAGMVVSLLYLAFVPMLSTAGSGGMIGGEAAVKAAAGRDFLSFALGGLNFIGMFMAIFTTLGAVYTEVENGTIVTLVTKPISRRQVIAGKWLGHALLMGGYVLAMGLALWLSVTAGSGTFVWSFFPSIALICLNVVTMASLTLLFSTFLPVVTNAIFVFLIMIFTSNLRIINAIGESWQSPVATGIAGSLRMLLPVSEVGDLAGNVLVGSAQAAPESDIAAFSPRGWSFLYEIVYLSALVLLAAYVFRKRDLK